MRRKLIIDGNSVYELDEQCMLTKRMEQEQGKKTRCFEIERRKQSKRQGWE